MEKLRKEIAELKRALLKAQQDIERLSKLKSDFLSIVSHELRTPLTSIKEGLSLVLDGVVGSINSEQREFLNMAKINMDRLDGVIGNMLDFVRLDSGIITMIRGKININAVIKDVSASFKDNVNKSNLRFVLDLSDELGVTWGDPDRISQVLRNLISNAIKFNKPKGKIKVSTRNSCMDRRNVIKVVVEDTGIGIPKEKISKLFNAFTPLDVSMTRSYSGIGLGLAICRRIIDFHGGNIWVESKKDAGTKFTFTIPS